MLTPPTPPPPKTCQVDGSVESDPLPRSALLLAAGQPGRSRIFAGQPGRSRINLVGLRFLGRVSEDQPQTPTTPPSRLTVVWDLIQRALFAAMGPLGTRRFSRLVLRNRSPPNSHYSTLVKVRISGGGPRFRRNDGRKGSTLASVTFSRSDAISPRMYSISFFRSAAGTSPPFACRPQMSFYDLNHESATSGDK